MENEPLEVWRVLLVDDDEDDYLLTRSMLSQAQGKKVELDWAPTYQSGKLQLQSNHYHAVLVDYDLGARTGIELIQETVAAGYSAPLILFTGRGSYDVDMEAMQAGATLYLAKSEANPLLLERSLRYAIERKRFEDELDRRLQERSDILQCIPDGFFAVDRDWRIRYINPRAAHTCGFEPEELIGQNIWQAFPELHGTLMEENYHRVMDERRPLQFEMRGVDPDPWYNISVCPSAEGVSIYWQDITERRQAEEALREVDNRLQEQAEKLEVQAVEELRRSQEKARYSLAELYSVYAAAPVGLCSLDTNLRYRAINEEQARINGKPAGEHIGKTLREVLHRDIADAVEPLLRRVLASGEPVLNQEISGTTAPDHARLGHWMVSYCPVRDEHGRVILVSCVMQEITERKAAEEALREQVKLQDQLTKIAVTVPGTISAFRLRPDGSICMPYASPALEDLYGLKLEDVREDAAPIFSMIHPEDVEHVRESIAESARRLTPWRDEYRLLHPIKGEIWIEGHSMPQLEPDGSTLWYGFIQDITERKQAEEALRRYELLAGHSRDIILFMRREDGRILEANAAAISAYGYNREELLALTIQELRAPHTQGLTADQMARADAKGILFETLHRRRDGSIFPVEVSSRGATVGGARTLISVVRDITERKQAEEAQRESEQRFRSVVESNMIGVVLSDLVTGEVIDANDEYLRIIGRSREELEAGRINWKAITPAEGLYREEQLTASIPPGGRLQPFEKEYLRPDSTRVPVIIGGSVLDDPPQRVVAFVLDNTDRKQAEEAVRLSQGDLARARSVAHTGSWRLDVARNELLWSDEAYRMFEIPKGTPLTYEAFLASVHPDDRDFVDQSWMNALRGEPYDIEHRILAGENVKWVRERAELEFDRQGRLLGGFGIVHDITPRKQAEGALRESEERYRSLFNNMTEGFAIHEVITDESGLPYDYRFLDINLAFERLTGLKREDVIGRTHNEILPGDDPKWVRIYGEVALTGEPVHFEDYSATLKRHYEVYSYHPAPRQFAVIFMDITKRKQAELALAQANTALHAYAEELKRSNMALEDFAFIASHDLREPLRKVQAFGDLLKSRYSQELDERGQDYIERMQGAVGRMQSMLDGLLTYARVTTQGQAFKRVDMNQIAREVLLDLEMRLAQTGGRVETGHLPLFKADPVQMRQLLQNLLGNALKFHRPGVPPLVTLTSKTISENSIELIVEDNGIGFETNQARHLFKPFHRLNDKSGYEGTGMGLAICRKIVERHGGSISAASQPGKGSIFIVTLPCEHCE